LDQRFESLDRFQHADWQRFSSIWPWSILCLPGLFQDEPPPEFYRWSKLCYTNVNCTRLEQGLSVTDSPPVVVTPRQDDFIVPSGSSSFAIRWIGRIDGVSTPCSCSVYARGLNHPSEFGPAITKMIFQFLAPISYNTEFGVSSVFSVSPGLASMPFVAMAYVVADLGGSPIFGGRQGFYADGSPG
jgi:hypothetical protein